jgi:signal transduction histidine kinase
VVPVDFMAGGAALAQPGPGVPGRPAAGRTAGLALAQRLHDTVVQRLAGLSLLLGSGQPLDAEATSICRTEISTALDELRSGLEGLVAETEPQPGQRVAFELDALAREHPDAHVECSAPREVLGDHVQPLVDAVLAEGLRNARKHAAPGRVVLELQRAAGTVGFVLRNDGSRPGEVRGCGMGLRLLELEASMAGGLIESGPDTEEGSWQLRLTLPAAT